MAKHVLLYGPPGAGKLTVARCLADRYGVKVVDNTLSIGVALRLFEFGTKPYWGLVERLRVELLGTAAREGVDVVSTFVYAHPVDRTSVERYAGATEAGGGVVTFVQLCPSRTVLERRIGEPSRADVAKLTDVAKLRDLLGRYDLTTPVHPDDLSIDNSDLPPQEAAARIALAAGLR